MAEVVYYFEKTRERAERHERCVLALESFLEERFSTYDEIVSEFLDIMFGVVPRRSTLEEVYAVNREIDRKKTSIAHVGITLFKIPLFVNDIEGYVRSLLRKHYDQR